MSIAKKKRKSAQLKGLILIGLASFALIAMGATALVLNMSKPTLERGSGCPTEGYAAVTAVLIDLTDPITPTQAVALRNTLLKIRNDVPRYGRLEIYPLQSVAKTAIEPLFAGCSPGSGRDVDNRYYGNPELADKLWRAQFADRVEGVIQEVQKLPQQTNSPILEVLQAVAVSAFGNPLAERAREKRLLIVSDMIHHTSELSMYQGAPSFSRFKTSQYYLRVKPMLRGASVDVSLVVRETRKNVQQPPLYQFWVEYVANSDGLLRHWEPMQ